MAPSLTHPLPWVGVAAALLTFATMPVVKAAVEESFAGDPAGRSIEQFLAKDGTQPSYKASRRLEARNGSRKGWMEALTEYTPAGGFRYQITQEGGSEYIRNKVLRAVLEGERDVIAGGETKRSSLALANYAFKPDGMDDGGLARVLLSPRRKERVLVSGTMFLTAQEGELVRLQGRLAKSPSFWIKDVDIMRKYDRIQGTVLPVFLETTAQLRFLGEGTLRMTYSYAEVDGRAVSTSAE